MIIKLTNAIKDHKGQSILINTDHIVSIFPDTITTNKVVDLVSTIYSITKETWVVKETPEEIYKQIKKETK